jgi:hypothetical protein
MVKNGFDIDYPSMLIGDMLDNYRFFTDTEWTEFTTSQGKEIVQFVGRYENPKDTLTAVVDEPTPQDVILRYYAWDSRYEVFRGTRKGFVKIQFAIYKQEEDDGTAFEYSYVGTKNDEDKEYGLTSNERQWAIIDAISKNKPLSYR